MNTFVRLIAAGARDGVASYLHTLELTLQFVDPPAQPRGLGAVMRGRFANILRFAAHFLGRNARDFRFQADATLGIEGIHNASALTTQ